MYYCLFLSANWTHEGTLETENQIGCNYIYMTLFLVINTLMVSKAPV